jgi:hypothetical protein
VGSPAGLTLLILLLLLLLLLRTVAKSMHKYSNE